MKKGQRKFNRQGNIVHTFLEGNTTIHICDDHFADTPEKVERVIEELHAAGWVIIDSVNRESGHRRDSDL